MNTYSYIVNGLVGYAWPLGFDSIVDHSFFNQMSNVHPFFGPQGVLTYLKLQDIICDRSDKTGGDTSSGRRAWLVCCQCWLTRVSMTARRAQPRTAVGEERGTGDHVLAPWMLRLACSRDE